MDSGPDFVRLAVGSKGGVVVSDGTDPSYLAVGANGQVLVADSGVSKGVAWVDPLSNRNVVINGAMQVAQRGTSTASITTNGYFTADRFEAFLSSLGTWTQSLEADAPTGSGLRNSVKMLCTTAAASPASGSFNFFRQKFEGQNLQQFLKGTASAKQFAVSFWVKSNVTGTYIAELEDDVNARTVSASYTISASATWEKKTIIFPADTTGAFANGNAFALGLNFWLAGGTNFTSGTLATTWAADNNANRAVGQTNLAAATNNYWQVTGVQLEAGAVATPFEFEDIGTTLAKCQRYYYLHASGAQDIGTGFYQTASEVQAHVKFPVTMRIAPSGNTVSGTDYYQILVNNIPDTFNDLVVFSSTNTALVYQTSNVSGTLGQAGRLTGNNAAARLAFSSEL
jgi:hypothetical protein